MAFRFFTIPIYSPDEPSRELNEFLRSRRIIKVDRQWVPEASLWSLCVEFLDGASATSCEGRSTSSREKIDYKEVLSPEDFAIFAKLRDMRKVLAQTDAVPVYSIFTNEQLARMVTSKATTRAALGKIEGVGEARLEKYSKSILEILATAWPTDSVTDETSGEPV
jgi:superfamily II DNA helicase RecQ